MSDYKGDKRTKEYKEWKKSKGLGDTVAKITEVTGIKSIVKALFGEDCGCDERQEKLNKLFPYSNYLTESEFTFLHEFFKTHHHFISQHQKQTLTTIFNRAFNQRRRITGCPKCYIGIIEQLKKLYDEYISDLDGADK